MGGTGAVSAESAVFRKVAWRLLPLLFLCYVVAFLDRVNVGFAKLQMAPDLAFSDAIYGFGAGIFFIGYFLFEVPSNLVLEKVGARRWIARIMISWGIVSAAFLFTGSIRWGGLAELLGCTDAEFTFYLLRFLLGAAEAGFYPGIILYFTYWFPADRRAQAVAWFMTGIAVSNAFGSPLSGAIMQYMDGLSGWRGWQWLFLIEGMPAVLLGLVVLAVLPDGPRSARWLTAEERDLVLTRVAADQVAGEAKGRKGPIGAMFADWRVWALASVYFLGTSCFYAVNFWMPTLIQDLGIGRADYLRIGLVSLIPWGVAAVVMVVWGIHSDRTGERRWHNAGGLAIAMAGLLLLALGGEDATLSIIGLTLVTSGTLAWVVCFWPLPTAFLSGSAAAAGIAWINSIGNLGGHFGPDLIGRVRTATGGSNEAAFLALAAAALLGILILLLVTRRQPERSREAPA